VPSRLPAAKEGSEPLGDAATEVGISHENPDPVEAKRGASLSFPRLLTARKRALTWQQGDGSPCLLRNRGAPLGLRLGMPELKESRTLRAIRAVNRAMSNIILSRPPFPRRTRPGPQRRRADDFLNQAFDPANPRPWPRFFWRRSSTSQTRWLPFFAMAKMASRAGP